MEYGRKIHSDMFCKGNVQVCSYSSYSTSASTEIVGVAMVRLRMLSRSRAVIGMLYMLVSPVCYTMQEELFLDELI